MKHFHLLIIIATILCSCNDSNIDHVYFDKSTERFDVDYKPQVESVKKFLKDYTNAYNERINLFYPRYKDWQVLRTETMLNSKATLYISNSRETLLSFDTASAKQLVVKATDYPIEVGIMLGTDVFHRYGEIKIPLSLAVKLYDSTNKLHGVGGYSYTQLSGVSSNVPVLGFMSTALVLLDSLKYYVGSNDSVIIQEAFMTNVKGFDSLIDSAKSFARIQAEQDAKVLFFESKPFRKALATQYLAPYATYMLEREEKQKALIEPYPFDEYQRNVDTLYQIGRRFGQSNGFVDSLYLFTSKTLPDYHGLYKNKDDLIWKWIGVNIIILLIVVFFKRRIERMFENLAGPVGFIQTPNLAIFAYFHNVLDFTSLVVPFLFGIFASLYLSWSDTDRKFRL